MLKIFRELRVLSVKSGATRKYFLYAVGEVLLVMIGILLALQVNNWNEENKKAKKGIEYLNSLCEDLQEDSIHLSYLIDSYQYKVEKLSYMEACYDSIKNNLGEGCIKTLIEASSSFDNMRNIDRTIQQLKYEGGATLLSSEDWNKILVYDMTIGSYKIDETTVFQETQTSLRNLMHELINFGSDYNQSNPPKNKELIFDQKVLNKYFNTLKLYREYCKQYYRMASFIKTLNGELSAYIKDKYSLDY